MPTASAASVTRISLKFVDEQEAQALADVAVDRPALLHRVNEAREVVVEQHDVRDVARDVGAARAHGHADVGRAQRGGVVDAVAGHRDDGAAGLERADDLVLVRRRHAREHVDVEHELPERGVIEPGEGRRFDDADRAVAAEAQLAADRGRGRGRDRR